MVSADEIAGEGAKAVLGELFQAAKDDPNMKKAGSNLAKSAATVTQTVNTILLPLAALNYGVERARDYFQSKFRDDLAKKLEGVADAELVEPKPSVAGPALQGLSFALEEPELKEMFLDLLVSSMKRSTSDSVHPAFGEIIRQMSNFDAQLARVVLNLENLGILQIREEYDGQGRYVIRAKIVIPHEGPTAIFSADARTTRAIENLIRLGLASVEFVNEFSDNAKYEWSTKHPLVTQYEDSIGRQAGSTLRLVRGVFELTEFGTQFAKVVGCDQPILSASQPMHIIEDDLTGPAIRALLEEHFAGMLANSPKDSCHFLDFEGLKGPGVTFWSIWDADQLMGCGALKQHDAALGEIKSMRTHADHLRKGAAAAMLEHIIGEARARGLTRLSLETGSGPSFEPAYALYLRYRFEPCEPFADYKPDPFSRFMTLAL